MKKITLLLFALLLGSMSYAQCQFTDQYPGSSINVSNVGDVQQISGCNYYGEYSVIVDLVLGDEYQFSVEGGYVTLRDSADSNIVLAQGPSPLNWTATVSGVETHWSLDAACAPGTGCKITSVQNLDGEMPPPPTNQTCATATSLACGNSLSGTSYGSTGTQEGSGCTMGNNGVWYTITGTGDNLTLSVTASFDHELAVTKGTCGALINVACQDGTSGIEEYTINNSVVGETYYVYIAQYSNNSTVMGSHSISLTCSGVVPPPTCATAVTIACGDTISGTSVGSTGTPEDIGCSIGNNGVWYTFTGTGDTFVIDVTSSFDHKLAIASGTCGALVNLGCEDSSSGAEQYTIANSVVGETYYLYFARYSSGSTVTGTHTITLTCTAPATPPDNETCATATAITCGETIAGTSVGSTGTQEGGTCSMGSNGVWYTFTGTGEDITVNTTASFDHEMSITSGTCGALVNIVCRDGSTQGETFTVTNSVLGESYYVYIAHYAASSSGTGTHTISLDCPPLSINDIDSPNGFTYHPNPVTNVLYLKGQSNISNVVIFNMLGQEMNHLTPNSISSDVDMSNLQTGAYFVKVTVGDATKTIRVIKD